MPESMRCKVGFHKWSRWDLIHRWCLKCRKVQFTPLGKTIGKAIFNPKQPQ